MQPEVSNAAASGVCIRKASSKTDLGVSRKILDGVAPERKQLNILTNSFNEHK